MKDKNKIIQLMRIVLYIELFKNDLKWSHYCKYWKYLISNLCKATTFAKIKVNQYVDKT